MPKLSFYKFDLPPRLIAQEPEEFRDECKLMVVHRDSGKIEHRKFKHIVEYLASHDVVVANNSKVFKARLRGHKEKTNAEVSIILMREIDPEEYIWDTIVEPARKIRTGNKLFFGDPASEDLKLEAEVIDNTTSRGRTVQFLYEGNRDEFYALIDKIGEIPIPYYIQRRPNEIDEVYFHTIFAKYPAAIVPPAAGFHISRETLKWFNIKDIHFTEVTLHMGIGVYRRIEVENLIKHTLDAEWFYMPAETARHINEAKRMKRQVMAVGISTWRAIEASLSADNLVIERQGWTDRFFFPPYESSVVTSLVTNFHFPQTPFFIMAATFGGRNLIKKAYQEAIKKKYRFGDYGDAMLIL